MQTIFMPPTFLSHFVEKGIDWIHMDLCTDTNKGGLGLVKTDVTGFGVRWGTRITKQLSIGRCMKKATTIKTKIGKLYVVANERGY